MATFTITTPVNIDSLTSKTGGDVYNINGGYLTIDQDSRYGLNQNTSASLGNMTLSASLGGTCEVNATLVRLIPYNSGSGNVPAAGTTISQGGASGILIGVYDTLAVAPTTAGSAMPADGFIKIKQWNSVAYAAGALTGIGATATGADVTGWIEIVGDEAGLCTVNRLNLFKVRGSYYEIGTTDGVRATTYQIPSNGTLQYHAGVEVETGAGTGVYEFYPCAGTLAATAANMGTDAVRGKVCWISSAGLLRFGHDGTNSTGGYIVPAGRKIRIYNIFFANCTTAARTANVLPNATLATRYEFATTGGGAIDIDKASIGWYMNINQPYSLELSNVGILTAIVATEIAAPLSWDNVNVGQEAANTQIALTLNLSFAGGTIANSKFTRAAQAATGTYVASMTDINGFDFTNCEFRSFVKAANATSGSTNLIRAVDCSFTTCTLGGGRAFLTTCTDVTHTNTVYYDHPSTTTPTTIPMYAFDIGSNCLRCYFDGLTFGGTLMQPYSGILNVGAAGCADIKLRNLGTYASPLDMGGTQQDGVAWTRVTTVATVTKVAHGLKVNDIVYVIISSDVAAITVAAKTVASVPTADTFTFTCLNAGATSGTLSYYPTMAGLLVAVAASAAANTVKVQRCYVPHLRTNIVTGDNSSKNVIFESVFGNYINAPLTPMLNQYSKGIGATLPLTAQTAVYGTHWFDYWTNEVSPNMAAQSWTRSTTTATVTSTNHGLRTGMLINVGVSSDTAAIVLGQKTVTVLTKDTFTFTCLNAGGASGTLTFAPLHGRVGLVMNEATADTTNQYTIDAGTTAFTSAGGLYMPVIGDQITFETPEFIIGHLNFPIAEAVMAGGTIANYTITYALDYGSGYGSFHNLYYQRTGAGGSSASTTVTMTSTTGVEAGDQIYGTNIAPNAKVVSVDNATTITVDIANTGTVSGTLRFNHLPSESAIPATGFKMKIRILTAATNATAITSLYAFIGSTATTRAYQYPLDPVDAVYSFSGLEVGTEVILFDSTNTELAREVIAGTTFEYPYTWTGTDSTGNYALIWKDDKFPIKFTGITLGNTSVDVPISQADDLVYAAGSTDNVTIDFANELIIMDTGATEFSVPGVYSIWKDTIRLSNNAQYQFAYSIVGGNLISGAKSIPYYTFQANGWKVRPDEADHTLSVVDGILVGESGADPFVDTLGAYTVRILFEQPVQAIAVSTGGGGGASAADIWSYSTRRLSATGITDITTGLATEANATTNANDIQADIAALNDLSSADIATALNTYDVPTKTELDSAEADIIAAIPTEVEIADQVWDEAKSGHVAAGSFGEQVGKKISTKAVPEF